ncbi:MAG TPA: hypothetical protein VK615_06620 [Candidatus Binatia bacterium]|nr:hypothetical protein [Candidatus Binatia bacterium]
MKTIRYYGGRAVRIFKTFPWTCADTLVQIFAVTIWPAEYRKGVRVIDLFSDTRAEFLSRIGDALELIESKDQRRFKRVKREIRAIVQMPCAMEAGYSRGLNVCRIDLRYYPFGADASFATVLLACALIHEATHGHLHRRRILQNARNFARVESLCYAEEIRFGNKLGFDLSILKSVGEAARPLTPEEKAKIVKDAFADVKKDWKRCLADENSVS